MNVKVGDKVQFCDDSGAATVKNGQLVAAYVAMAPKKVFTVVAIDCDIPFTSFWDYVHHNDLILTHEGQTYFAKSEYLQRDRFCHLNDGEVFEYRKEHWAKVPEFEHTGTMVNAIKLDKEGISAFFGSEVQI